MGSNADTKAFERWNTHFSTIVRQEVLGVNLRLAQDPSSEHLGTTVWDASIVLAKFFEKNMRKGEFSRPKATGKRAIELGAGMGLAGLAFALIGANVLLTDVAGVMPLLQRNYENNLSAAALRAAGSESHLASCGSVSVAELDWTQPQHYAALSPPPFDYVLAADCIYHETLLRHLYRVMLAITNERSTIIIANERRSESVQSAFTGLFSQGFSFKKVPLAKQDPDFCHPAIELYILKKKKGASDASLTALEAEEAAAADAAAAAEAQLAATSSGLQQLVVQEQRQEQPQQHRQQQQPPQQAGAASQSSDDAEQQQQQPAEQQQQQQEQQQQDQGVVQLTSSSQPEQELCASSQPAEQPGASSSQQLQQVPLQQQQQVPWQTRRAGVEAARLLAGVQVPQDAGHAAKQ